MRPVIRPPVTPRASSVVPQQMLGRRLLWSAATLTILILLTLHFRGHSADGTSVVRSGLSGTCLDVLHGSATDGTPIDVAKCNGTSAQNWTTTATAIRHSGTKYCVMADARGAIMLHTCLNVPGQIWLRDRQGYYNPNTGKCLSASKAGEQLRLTVCNGTLSAGEVWMPEAGARQQSCVGEDQKVACEAVAQWNAWEATGSNHNALLEVYTDGTPYEEWCADFVSYVYKEAGYPFTRGGADGWDENNSNDIQYMGFVKHVADGSYQPKSGDVAFFNYPGGHVEIVVSGGKRPTFVYGDSAEIDPTTNNGQMKANTITQDDSGELGKVVYYLSPVGT